MVTTPLANLRETIKNLNDAYYRGEPLVSDEEFDRLFLQLKELEEQKEKVNTSVRVNAPTLPTEKTFKHGIPMLSLQTEIDTSQNGLLKFLASIGWQLGFQSDFSIDLVAQFKMDGLGLNLQYEDGHLMRVLTRGDGEVGEDVTHALELFRGAIPNTLEPAVPGLLEIRGEAMLSNSQFAELNAFLELNNQSTRSNPRNSVAGLVRTTDPTRYPAVVLEFFPYSFGYRNPGFCASETEFIAFVQKQGFKVQSWFSQTFVVTKEQFAPDVFSVFKFYSNAQCSISEGRRDYLADGVVYKIDSFALQEQLGFRTREPRWAVAQKFPPTARTSKLLDVTFEIGRTGKITPVGHITLTLIDGVRVSKATLHNVFDIRQRNVRVGDEVTIYRSGDTIPEIGYRSHSAVRYKYQPNIRMIKRCPCCKSVLLRAKGEVNYYCTASTCKAKLQAAVRHFVSRSAMDIRGIGEETIQKLVNDEHIKSYADVFTLDPHQLEEAGMAPACVSKVIVAIRLSLNNDDWRFLSGIGIRGVGVYTAKAICKVYGLNELPKLTHGHLTQVSGIDTKTADAIVSYFQNEANATVYHFMWWYVGCSFNPTKRTTKGKLEGFNVVFSGSFPVKYRRDFLEEVVERKGGKVTREVTKDTNLFVVGESPTVRKLEKATSLGVKIVSPQEFIEITKK